jgi:hypothetical protein
VVEYYRRFLRYLISIWLGLVVASCALPIDGPLRDARDPGSEGEAWSEPARIPVHEAEDAQGEAAVRAMIYIGSSTWMAEADSIEQTLRTHHYSYQEWTPSQLNQAQGVELEMYQLLIIPGGYAPGLVSELSVDARAMLRTAVREGIMDYLGFCAGAWLAVSPPEPDSDHRSYGIGFIDGPMQRHAPMEDAGGDYGLVEARLWDGSVRKLLWWGGPSTPEAAQEGETVLARYPGGEPAISVLRAGKGRAVLSGLHPTATQAVLNSIGVQSSESIAPDITLQLVKRALGR